MARFLVSSGSTLGRRLLWGMVLAPWIAWANPAHGLDSQKPDSDALDDEFALLAEEEKVYSAAKHEQDKFDAPSTVTVITREQIENSPCADIPCLLSQMPELEVRFVDPWLQSVGARALADEGSNKGLLLVDGRELNYEDMGMPFYGALPIHLVDIERIEVVRGPGSALYGANAHSLVISITTRQVASNSTEVFLSVGEHGSQNVHGRVGLLLGGWGLQLKGGWQESDAWRIRGKEEEKLFRLGLKLENRRESGTDLFNIDFLNSSGSFYTVLAPVDVPRLVQGSLSYVHLGKWLSLSSWFETHRLDLELDLPLFYNGMKLGTIPDLVSITTMTWNVDGQINWSPFTDNLLLAGVNYRFLTLNCEQSDPARWFQHRLGVFLQDEQRLWTQWLLTVGMRLDYNSITPLTFSPRVTLGWRAARNQSLNLSFGLGFKKPPYLYSSIHVVGVKGTAAFPELPEFVRKNLSNPDLDNESIAAVELAYRGGFLENKLMAEADVFYHQYRKITMFAAGIVTNSIGLPDLKNSVFRFENKGENVDTIGGSGSLSYTLHQSILVLLNYTYRYSMYVSANPPEYLQDTSRKWEAGDRVPWEPAHLFNAILQYHQEEGLKLALGLHARSGYAFFMSTDGGAFSAKSWVQNPATLYMNGLLGWRFKFGDRFLEAGIRVFDLFHVGFRDTPMVVRFDGKEIGGELNGRKVWLYLSAGI